MCAVMVHSCNLSRPWCVIVERELSFTVMKPEAGVTGLAGTVR